MAFSPKRGEEEREHEAHPSLGQLAQVALRLQTTQFPPISPLAGTSMEISAMFLPPPLSSSQHAQLLTLGEVDSTKAALHHPSLLPPMRSSIAHATPPFSFIEPPQLTQSPPSPQSSTRSCSSRSCSPSLTSSSSPSLVRSSPTSPTILSDFSSSHSATTSSTTSATSTTTTTPSSSPVIKPNTRVPRRFAACVHCHTARRRCTLTTDPQHPCKRCKDKALVCESRPRKRSGPLADGGAPEQKVKICDKQSDGDDDDERSFDIASGDKNSLHDGKSLADPLQVCIACHNAKRRCSLMSRLEIPCERCTKKRVECVIRSRKRLGRPSVATSPIPTAVAAAPATPTVVVQSNGTTYERSLKIVRDDGLDYKLDLSGLPGLNSVDLPPRKWILSNLDSKASNRFHTAWVEAWQEKFTPQFINQISHVNEDTILTQAAIDASLMCNLGENRSVQLLKKLKGKMSKKLAAATMIFSLNSDDSSHLDASNNMDLWPVACTAWDYEYRFDSAKRKMICNAQLFMNKTCAELLGISPEQYLHLYTHDSVPMAYRCYHEDDWKSLLRAHIHNAMYSGRASCVHNDSRICRLRTNRGIVFACVMSTTVKFNNMGLLNSVSTCYMPLPGQDIPRLMKSEFEPPKKKQKFHR